ncbi:MAG TPA: NosD domain-containing protein [Anaerolineae bacterium]|nr:NosD domain-containing protein [Anaerolineae bacterium]
MGGAALVWSTVQVRGNTIIGNTASHDGAGLYTYYDKGSSIEANVIMSNTADRWGGGVGVYITVDPGPTQLVNNVIAHNQAAVSGGGLYGWSDWNISAVALTHNTLASNGTAIGVGRNMTATLVNNSVVGHTVGITVTDPDGNAYPDHTLFWGNADDGIRGSSPVDSDPAFVDPARGDYHLTPGSGGIDCGVNAGVARDIDHDLRPMGAGYDIGADEQAAHTYLPVMVKIRS